MASQNSLPWRFLTRLWRWSFLSLKYLFLGMMVYLLCCLIGLIPVNNNFQNSPDGIPVIIISNAVHSDLVLPIEAAGWNWRDHFPAADFQGNTAWATHVAVGWGDRGFFIHTPEWSDLKLSTAVNALLWPSSTCVHVSMTKREFVLGNGIEVRLTEEQYRRLVEKICTSFGQDPAERLQLIPDSSYHQYDAFYVGVGRYHLFNTCNNWVGRTMKHSGMRVGWFTPLPKSVFLWLPISDDASL